MPVGDGVLTVAAGFLPAMPVGDGVLTVAAGFLPAMPVGGGVQVGNLYLRVAMLTVAAGFFTCDASGWW
jgi:hypothetical protein